MALRSKLTLDLRVEKNVLSFFFLFLLIRVSVHSFSHDGRLSGTFFSPHDNMIRNHSPLLPSFSKQKSPFFSLSAALLDHGNKTPFPLVSV